jgi:hypothetical protein
VRNFRLIVGGFYSVRKSVARGVVGVQEGGMIEPCAVQGFCLMEQGETITKEGGKEGGDQESSEAPIRLGFISSLFVFERIGGEGTDHPLGRVRRILPRSETSLDPPDIHDLFLRQGGGFGDRLNKEPLAAAIACAPPWAAPPAPGTRASEGNAAKCTTPRGGQRYLTRSSGIA